MTSYVILSQMLTAAGVKNASPTRARELSERDMRGGALSDLETQVMAAWVALKWTPDLRQVKKPGE